MAKAVKTKGSVVRIWGTFSDPDTDDPLDPFVLTIEVDMPDGTVATTDYPDPELTQVSTGVYFLALALLQGGTYHWKWTASNGPDRVLVLEGSLESVTRWTP